VRRPLSDAERAVHAAASADLTVSELPTPRHYAGVHRVDAGCVACDRWVTLDLDDLIRRGLGDVPLIRLPLRCSGCGRKGHKIVVSGRSYALGSHVDRADPRTP
jgi:hypothetical protein